VNILDKQRQFALTILATISITYLVENFLRSAASALTPVLIQELGISRGSMGLLITAYYLIYGIMQFPSGVLADVLGPRRSIIGFTAITCIGSILFWMSYRYELLFAAQFTMGIGTSVFYINAITLIGRWFPPERKATAIGILSASMGVGAFASFMGLPLAATLWGNWRSLYLAMLGILVINWVMNFFILKDSPNIIKSNFTQKKRRNILRSFKEAFSDHRFHPPLLGYMMMCFIFALYSWINQFLIEEKGLTYIEAGTVSSIGTVAGFIGCLLIGVISDRLRKRKLPLLLFYGINLLLLCGIILVPAKLPVAVYAAIWFGMGICGSIWILFFSMVSEVLPPEIVGIGLGLLNGLGNIFSSLITPIYGSLVDITGSYYTPNIISLGLGVVTLVILIIYMKETYGATIKEQEYDQNQ
jgi:MFS family permease